MMERELFVFLTLCWIIRFTDLAPALVDNTSAPAKPKPGRTSVSLGNTWYKTYKLGENFTLPCVIFGLLPDQYILFVRLIDDTDIVISNGTFVHFKYRRTGRYYITVRTTNESTIYSLNINDMTSDDGGRLGCKIGPEKYGMTSYTGSVITVHVPIYELKMEYKIANGSYTRVAHGGQVLFMNTWWRMHSGVRCQVTVNGGAIEPKVELYLSKERITKRFNVTTERVWAVDGGRRHWERGYRVTYTYETYHPQTSDNDKLLECLASVPWYDERRVAVTLNVTYPATFWCGTKKYGWPKDYNVRIGCNVSMNPPQPAHALWWWREGVGEQQLGPAVRFREYSTGHEMTRAHTTHFHLTITWLEDKHFHTYMLEIDNGMGLRTLHIRIIQGADPDRSVSLHSKDNVLYVGVGVATGLVTHGYGFI